jgi:hypothetical protein
MGGGGNRINILRSNVSINVHAIDHVLIKNFRELRKVFTLSIFVGYC